VSRYLGRVREGDLINMMRRIRDLRRYLGRVREGDLINMMRRMRDLRRWAHEHQMDPWAVRQALVIALALDTAAALKYGVSSENLEAFDREIRDDVQGWVEAEEREER